MIAIEYHADLKEVQSDAQLAEFLGDSVQSAPFDRLAWWQGLADHCGIAPMLIVARDGENMVALPLQSSQGYPQALANWYSFRVRPVTTPGADTFEMLVAMARDLARRAHHIALAGVPDEDGSAGLIEEAFREAGWLVMRRPCDTNHILPVRGRCFDDYLAARPGQLRTTLKRKTARVEVAVLTQFDAAVWADYETIYRQSWKPEEGSPDFLRQFAEEEGKAGRLRLGLARADGRAVAAQMWTVEGKVAFIHKLAHLEEAKHLSPGSVLSAALFRHAIDEDRVELIDFGTGDDGYKRDWMEEVRLRYQLDMFRPANPRSWKHIVKSGPLWLAGKDKRG